MAEEGKGEVMVLQREEKLSSFLLEEQKLSDWSLVMEIQGQ